LDSNSESPGPPTSGTRKKSVPWVVLADHVSAGRESSNEKRGKNFDPALIACFRSGRKGRFGQEENDAAAGATQGERRLENESLRREHEKGSVRSGRQMGGGEERTTGERWRAEPILGRRYEPEKGKGSRKEGQKVQRR